MPRENALLQHVYASNAALPAGDTPGSVTIPPGDDMAAIHIAAGGSASGGDDLLVAVDQLAEGVHFDLTQHAIDRVGRKAITRNLSDIAAMAAQPVAALAAAALPRSMPQQTAEQLFDALRKTAAHYGCPLVGGDITTWDAPLLLSVTVFAQPAGLEPVRRGTAQPGDALYVTGRLGNAIAGHHLDFEPRLAVARALAGNPATRPTAMIDLSDGLAQDLPRLCDHAEVDATRLPLRDATPTTPGTPADSAPAWQHALGDGEDYELLFACPRPLPEKIEGVEITRIGTVRHAGGIVVRDPAGQPVDLSQLGWEHGR